MSLAASLALYTLLSLAPLVVISVSVAGLVFGDLAARSGLSHTIESVLGSEARQSVETLLSQASLRRSSLIGTAVGVVLLLVGASGMFMELQESLNLLLGVKAKPGRGLFGFVRDRFLAFAMVLGAALLLLGSLIANTVLSAASHFVGGTAPGVEASWQVANFALSFGTTTVLFGILFKVVPEVKIQLRDVWMGAVLTALLFTVGKLLVSLYLGKIAPGSAFGAAGSGHFGGNARIAQ